MTTQELFKLAIKTETFHTNNAWGVGGGSGVQYTFQSGHYLRVGTASYRHAPSTKFAALYTPEHKRILDEKNSNQRRYSLDTKKIGHEV